MATNPFLGAGAAHAAYSSPYTGGGQDPTGYWGRMGARGEETGAGGQKESMSRWYNPFSWGKTRISYTPDPGAYYMPFGVPGWGSSLADQQQAMQWGGDVRARQAYMLGILGQRARGQNLASEKQAAIQAEKAQAQIASRAASAQRGGYDPATQRGAMLAQANAAQGIAGQAAYAGALESNQAAQAFMQAAQGMRGTDVTQGLGALSAANQMRALALQDKYKEWAARAAYDQAMMQGYMGATEQGAFGPALGSVLGAVGGGLVSGWNPYAMQTGASMGSSLGGAASNW